MASNCHLASIKTAVILEPNYRVLNVIDSFFDSELSLINYYAVFRCDRNSDTSNCYRGGGALIAIRNNVCELLPTTACTVEHLFVRFHVQNVTFVVCSVYILPNSSVLVYESFMSAVQNCYLSQS
ncbi:Reverse transcriptase domain-containing protein [Aphis craccivora]|uniref:Reverse transcriptase domain-containing protein n=1 Tax=Aphis craccivora TaxID=307492 RepID=A0A6G0XSS4_APHCR|nr:Reverse transcriptase domain-containing protein [Aphis craccivora]